MTSAPADPRLEHAPSGAPMPTTSETTAPGPMQAYGAYNYYAIPLQMLGGGWPAHMAIPAMSLDPTLFSGQPHGASAQQFAAVPPGMPGMGMPLDPALFSGQPHGASAQQFAVSPQPR
jgi:hypothetical protein